MVLDVIRASNLVEAYGTRPLDATFVHDANVSIACARAAKERVTERASLLPLNAGRGTWRHCG
jgi:hypothetical protein